MAGVLVQVNMHCTDQAPHQQPRLHCCSTTAPAGARLVDLVVGPRTLVESCGRLRLHTLYYITKQIIPALERVLSLVGADCR